MDRVLSPGGWHVPSGRRPGWQWLPPGETTARPDRMPRWVRIWSWAPFLDRYAYQWMWFHGGWDVDPPEGLEPAAAARLVPSTPAPRRRSSGRPVGPPLRVVTLVIGLFDPAEAYMRRQLPRPARRSPLWWMRRPRRTGVDTEDDERVAALEAMWSSREYRERMHAAHEAAMRATQDRWGAQAGSARMTWCGTGARCCSWTPTRSTAGSSGSGAATACWT